MNTKIENKENDEQWFVGGFDMGNSFSKVFSSIYDSGNLVQKRPVNLNFNLNAQNPCKKNSFEVILSKKEPKVPKVSHVRGRSKKQNTGLGVKLMLMEKESPPEIGDTMPNGSIVAYWDYLCPESEESRHYPVFEYDGEEKRKDGNKIHVSFVDIQKALMQQLIDKFIKATRSTYNIGNVFVFTVPANATPRFVNKVFKDCLLACRFYNENSQRNDDTILDICREVFIWPESYASFGKVLYKDPNSIYICLDNGSVTLDISVFKYINGKWRIIDNIGYSNLSGRKITSSLLELFYEKNPNLKTNDPLKDWEKCEEMKHQLVHLIEIIFDTFPQYKAGVVSLNILRRFLIDHEEKIEEEDCELEVEWRETIVEVSEFVELCFKKCYDTLKKKLTTFFNDLKERWSIKFPQMKFLFTGGASVDIFFRKVVLNICNTKESKERNNVQLEHEQSTVSEGACNQLLDNYFNSNETYDSTSRFLFYENGKKYRFVPCTGSQTGYSSKAALQNDLQKCKTDNFEKVKVFGPFQSTPQNRKRFVILSAVLKDPRKDWDLDEEKNCFLVPYCYFSPSDEITKEKKFKGFFPNRENLINLIHCSTLNDRYFVLVREVNQSLKIECCFKDTKGQVFYDYGMVMGFDLDRTYREEHTISGHSKKWFENMSKEENQKKGCFKITFNNFEDYFIRAKGSEKGRILYVDYSKANGRTIQQLVEEERKKRGRLMIKMSDEEENEEKNIVETDKKKNKYKEDMIDDEDDDGDSSIGDEEEKDDEEDENEKEIRSNKRKRKNKKKTGAKRKRDSNDSPSEVRRDSNSRPKKKKKESNKKDFKTFRSTQAQLPPLFTKKAKFCVSFCTKNEWRNFRAGASLNGSEDMKRRGYTAIFYASSKSVKSRFPNLEEKAKKYNGFEDFSVQLKSPPNEGFILVWRKTKPKGM